MSCAGTVSASQDVEMSPSENVYRSNHSQLQPIKIDFFVVFEQKSQQKNQAKSLPHLGAGFGYPAAKYVVEDALCDFRRRRHHHRVVGLWAHALRYVKQAGPKTLDRVRHRYDTRQPAISGVISRIVHVIRGRGNMCALVVPHAKLAPRGRTTAVHIHIQRKLHVKILVLVHFLGSPGRRGCRCRCASLATKRWPRGRGRLPCYIPGNEFLFVKKTG
jgi:hypothetical protein